MLIFITDSYHNHIKFNINIRHYYIAFKFNLKE